MNKYLVGVCLAALTVAMAVMMSSERSHGQATPEGQKSTTTEVTSPISAQTSESVRAEFRETETILPPADGGRLVLGDGVSLDRLFPGHGTAFEPKQPRSITKVDNPKADIRMVLVTSAKAMDAAMGLNVEAKARFPFSSVKATTEFGRVASISEDTFKLLIVAEAEYGTDELTDATLKPHAAALLKEARMKEFAEIYGTHYVYRQTRIAKLVLTIGVDNWSDTTRERLRASLKGGMSVGLGSGDLSLQIQNDLKSSSARKAVSVEVFTIGGKGLPGFADLIKLMLEKEDDCVKKVGDKVKDIVEGFNRDNSGIGTVTVRSYREFGWDPAKLSLWNDLFEERLQRCADLYYQAKKFSAHLQQLKPNATPAILKEVSDLMVAYDQYLLELAKLQKGLLAMDEAALTVAFPEEPVMTAATAKSVVVELATLESRFNRKVNELAKQVEQNTNSITALSREHAALAASAVRKGVAISLSLADAPDFTLDVWDGGIKKGGVVRTHDQRNGGPSQRLIAVDPPAPK